MLAESGFSVYGCEMDPAKAKLAAQFAEVAVCDIRDWTPPTSFDLIVCAELLEHLPPNDQVSLLANLRRWLRPGGRVILSTPQRNSSVALMERAYSVLRKRGRYNWWDPSHVNVLRRKDLERLISESGFTVNRRIGSHIVSELLPLPAFHWTVHEGPLSVLGFDLVYVLS